MKKNDSTEQIIFRMKEAAGATTDAELGQLFDLTGAAVSAWRQRKSVPEEMILAVATRFNVNAPWLLSGEGMKNDSDVASFVRESGGYSGYSGASNPGSGIAVSGAVSGVVIKKINGNVLLIAPSADYTIEMKGDDITIKKNKDESQTD